MIVFQLHSLITSSFPSTLKWYYYYLSPLTYFFLPLGAALFRLRPLRFTWRPRHQMKRDRKKVQINNQLSFPVTLKYGFFVLFWSLLSTYLFRVFSIIKLMLKMHFHSLVWPVVDLILTVEFEYLTETPGAPTTKFSYRCRNVVFTL